MDGETPRDKQQSHCCPRDTEHHGVHCVMPAHAGVREGCGLLLSCLSWPNPPRSQLAAKPGWCSPGCWSPGLRAVTAVDRRVRMDLGEGRQPTTTHTTHIHSLLQAIMNFKEVYRLHLALQPTRFAKYKVVIFVQWNTTQLSKELNNIMCSIRAATRDYHTKWSELEKERQISQDITYTWYLKYDANEPIYKTEIDSQTENRLVSAKGEGAGEGQSGRRGQQM